MCVHIDKEWDKKKHNISTQADFSFCFVFPQDIYSSFKLFYSTLYSSLLLLCI